MPPADTSPQIVPVRGWAARERFLRVPWLIYRNDPLWVPPILHERRAFISPRHPFQQYGAVELFTAELAGQTVGRIMVADNPHTAEAWQDSAGTCGLFESVNNRNVAAALFSAAADWLRARGRRFMYGPIDYSMNYTCGCLVEGFETPPRLMMNHHPPYYAELFAACGWNKAKDLYAWWFEPNEQIAELRTRLSPLIEKSRVTLRPLNKARRREEMLACKRIYHESWAENWGFVPMTDAEFVGMTRDIIDWARPELLLIAECDGEPIGFSMSLPDLNEAMKSLDGRLFRWGVPLGYLELCRNWHKIQTVRMLVLGVRREFRRRAVAEQLVLETFDAGRRLGYTGAELSWTLEDNLLINRMIKAVGGTHYKTYRVFEKAVG